jgi:hypothetical protein
MPGALPGNVMPLWPPFSSRLSDQPPLGPSCHSFIPTTSPVIGSALKVPSPSATSSGSTSTTHNAATGNGSLNSTLDTCHTACPCPHAIQLQRWPFCVATYIDNIRQALQKSGRLVKAIRARLKGKEGRLCGNLIPSVASRSR